MRVTQTYTPSNGAMIICSGGTGDYVKKADHEKIVADLSAALKAMTEDRDLWQGEHEGDCPHVAMVEYLNEENRRITQPVTDEEWDKRHTVSSGYIREFVNELLASRSKEPKGATPAQ